MRRQGARGLEVHPRRGSDATEEAQVLVGLLEVVGEAGAPLDDLVVRTPSVERTQRWAQRCALDNMLFENAWGQPLGTRESVTG